MNQDQEVEELRKLLQEIKVQVARLETLMNLMQDNYVTRAEFEPVRNLVYGLVGLLLTGVVGAMIALIMK